MIKRIAYIKYKGKFYPTKERLDIKMGMELFLPKSIILKKKKVRI